VDLPRIGTDRAGLDAVELMPFRAAIAADVQAVMTGHLLVPAIDPDLPATLSDRVLGGLLRDELGFRGAVVTDAIEMRAITDRYGFEAAAVRAVAAGADAICVGGEHADEESARRLRDALVDAVLAGVLPEERLAEAAKRVGQLAAWAGRPDDGGTALPAGTAFPASTAPSGGAPVGLVAARRAVRCAGDVGELPLTGPAHVVELVPPTNLAIGPETPWGVGGHLADLLPGTTTVRVDAGGVDALGRVGVEAATSRRLVVVVRDVHRYDWMGAALATLLAARPDAVVVEMGVPVATYGRVRLATYGATRACGLAAAEILSGRTA
jgi:beta-N-acetylhexosaminidase